MPRRAFLLALALFVGPPPAAVHISAVTAAPQLLDPAVHSPPVEAEVLDPFRAPAAPFGPGNRGIEYDTAPGVVVRASADGVVVFAGSVAGKWHVTVRHSESLRTTAAFVAEILVDPGARVRRGQPIAVTDGPFHFTARIDDRYVDPDLLFGILEVVVRLIPVR